jgi:PDZ domain-containing protein
VSQEEPPDNSVVTGDAPPDAAGPGDGPTVPPPSWALEPPVRRRIWPWVFGAFCSLLIVASIVASFVQLPYYTIAPGDALDVNQLVTVRGARHYPPTGALMLLFVRERSRVNAWRWLQASFDSDIDLYKQKEFTGGADPAELDAEAVAAMAVSQSSAKYLALRRLGYKVGVVHKLTVIAVIRGKPAAAVLRPGDTIVSIDGKKVTEFDALTKVIGAHKPGDRISVRYIRGGRPASGSLRVTRDEKGHPVIGVFLQQPYKFPVDVHIDTSDIGGPSAGLAMTLSVLDELTPGNLTGGKRVAVTGEIDEHGRVLPIGGVGQKAVAARHRGAQLFIVPFDEVAEARRRSGSLRVVGVKTLDDALKALRAAGGDALPALDDGAVA